MTHEVSGKKSGGEFEDLTEFPPQDGPQAQPLGVGPVGCLSQPRLLRQCSRHRASRAPQPPVLGPALLLRSQVGGVPKGPWQ